MPLGPALTAALQATVVAGARTADAIVVGAGATGGLAARLLTEAGLRVLVLDAGLPRSSLRTLGRRLSHYAARRLLGSSGPKVLNRLLSSPIGRNIIARRQPIQSRCYAWPLAPWQFVDDVDCPYVTPPGHPFVWLRARQLGGRMVIPGHGRQYYRFSAGDFSPADGLSPIWPLQTGELDPWYSSVERRLALAGMRDNVAWQPESELARVLKPTLAEAALQRSIIARWPYARPLLGRFAPPPDDLEAAARTGRLRIRQGAIARRVDVDRAGRVRGVTWIDQQAHAEKSSDAPLVFLCASALESTRLLLLSGSQQSPGGLGASSGVLGHYLMDHVRLRIEGNGSKQFSEPPDEDGRCLYLPRFDARNSTAPEQRRGFGVQVFQLPATDKRSYFVAVSFAEMLPRPENRVTLDPKSRDAWGIPVLHINCSLGDPELTRAREQVTALRELAEVAGVTVTHIDELPPPPGSANHECGTARMGDDPKNSVLDPHNECWEAQGLYVTDGACFPSQGCQNPTLTMLALTARACDHAMRTAHGR